MARDKRPVRSSTANNITHEEHSEGKCSRKHVSPQGDDMAKQMIQNKQEKSVQKGGTLNTHEEWMNE